MSLDEKKSVSSAIESADEDDKELLAMGYKPSFKREFTNLATVRGDLVSLEVVRPITMLHRSALHSVSWFVTAYDPHASPFLPLYSGSLLKYFHNL